MLVPICALGFLAEIDGARIQRILQVSELAGEAPAIDPASPTGYAGGVRQLIVPEHNNASYQWIAQTQQIFSRGAWRIRHVDYDNAPLGREVRSTSPYRWWLALLASGVHLVSGRPLALAVEQAALFADPLLHALLLLGATMFVARRFDPFSAGLLAVALAVAFPLAVSFSPGQPDDRGLALACALGSVLPLLTALRNGPATPAQRRDDLRLAGIAGGLGLWVSVRVEVPVLAGIALGGLLAARLTPRAGDGAAAPNPSPSPWTVWSLSGAATVLGCYLVEYFPSHMGTLQVDTLHPVYGLAWLGLGGLLAGADVWRRDGRAALTLRNLAAAALALVAIATVPAAMRYAHTRGFLAAEVTAPRLPNLFDGIFTPNLWTWIRRDGFTPLAAITLLPLVMLGPAVWRLARQVGGHRPRSNLAVALGPAVVALGFACLGLSGWSLLDAMLLPLLVLATVEARTDPKSNLSIWLWVGGVLLVLAPAVPLLVPARRIGSPEQVSTGEVTALVERDLAHWLANRVGPAGAVVLAPPNLTTSLYFHGGLRGLGTPYLENRDGLAAAVRIAGATSPDEAHALVRKRGVTHIVIPSWDPFLDEYARLGTNQPENSLIGLLHRWLPPRWLRPIPYQMPGIPGFEGQSAVVFEVVDVQDNAVALSHLAEYFVEMAQPGQAAAVGRALEKFFPDDFSALVARAEVDLAVHDPAGFGRRLAEIPPYLDRGDDETLPWDRRVSLAVVLAEGQRFEPAKQQVKRCLAEIDEPRLRSLTAVSLYRLLVVARAFHQEIANPRLRALARRLLPAELRAGT